jgi:hypothetical protein
MVTGNGASHPRCDPLISSRGTHRPSGPPWPSPTPDRRSGLAREHVRDRVSSQQLFMHPELVIRFVHVPPDGAAPGWHTVPATGGVRDPHGRVTRWRSPKRRRTTQEKGQDCAARHGYQQLTRVPVNGSEPSPRTRRVWELPGLDAGVEQPRAVGAGKRGLGRPARHNASAATGAARGCRGRLATDSDRQSGWAGVPV